MPIIARDEDARIGPPDEERLAWERASRAVIRRIFAAALEDRWAHVVSLFDEARSQGEWFQVAVWAGLPATVKERIRSEHEDQRTR